MPPLLFIYFSLPHAALFSRCCNVGCEHFRAPGGEFEGTNYHSGYGRMVKMQISTECGCPAGNFHLNQKGIVFLCSQNVAGKSEKHNLEKC
jgi:hypothetical protein